MEEKASSKIMFDSADLQDMVYRLGAEISIDHVQSDNTLPPVVIGILNGSIHFFSDLVRAMSIECEIDFIRLKSYEGQDNSGGITCTKDLEVDLKGKRVYLVDDICDSGATILEALFMVNSRMASEVKVVTMLKRKNGTSLSDFNGFEIDDEWVVGYGLDDNKLKRNQNRIYSI
jgi:hypoxanthine phosphoribosyltransferase